MEGLYGVVNDSEGTGYGAHREDMTLAGKTGTAELKVTQEDTSGTEIGWFSVFTTDRNAASPILLISMVEDVKTWAEAAMWLRRTLRCWTSILLLNKIRRRSG